MPDRVDVWTHLKLRTWPQVSSAFSQLLNLHNLSEEISSAQLERAVRMGEVRTPGPIVAVSWLITQIFA